MNGYCSYCGEKDELRWYEDEKVCDLCIEEFENQKEQRRIDEYEYNQYLQGENE